MTRKLIAEFLGTFWLVLGGCGAAVLSSGAADTGIGWLGVAIAFGLAMMTAGYAFGHISGAHFNPAVTLGLWAGKRLHVRHIVPYIVVQIVAAITAAGVLYLMASGKPGFSIANGFAANGYGPHSPGGYGLGAALVAESVLTFLFMAVIMGATDGRASHTFAPMVIGVSLTLIHLVGIPITNLSVNPARSIGPALFVGGWAIEQLWLFLLVPTVSAIVAGWLYHVVMEEGTGPERD